MPGTTSRNKGQRGEREVCGRMTDELGLGEWSTRVLDQARDGKWDITAPGFGNEVKYCEREELSKWIRQAKKSVAGTGRSWSVIYRPNHSDWRVVLETDIQGLCTLIRENIKC